MEFLSNHGGNITGFMRQLKAMIWIKKNILSMVLPVLLVEGIM